MRDDSTDGPVDTSFDDLESELSEELELEIDISDDMDADCETAVNACMEVVASADTEIAAGERLTPHSHGRLSSLGAADEARARSQKNLEIIYEALVEAFAATETTREFLDASRDDIRRSNRLELDSAGYAGECRRLHGEVDRLRKECERHLTQIDLQKSREGRFLQVAELLREHLNAAKLELAETANLLSASESTQAQLQADLSVKTSLVERLSRDCDVLRGKLANSSADFDAATRKLSELRRRHDDLAALHADAAAGQADMAAKLAAAESECARLQKCNDLLEARHEDDARALKEASVEADEREKRYQSDVHALRHENQVLSSRLCAKTAEQLETVSENMSLRTRLDDVEARTSPGETTLVTLDEGTFPELPPPTAATEPPAPANVTKLHGKKLRRARNEIKAAQRSNSAVKHARAV